MPKLRLILVAGALAGASIGILGCGGGGPSPSIPPDSAATLLGKIQEIQANVANGSCFVASDRANALISDIQNLPSSVDSQVKNALDNGAKQLTILLSDPTQCQHTTSTTTSTTPSTQSTTTTHTQSTTTTHTQTQPTTTTTPTAPTVTSGGIGPGGTGQ